MASLPYDIAALEAKWRARWEADGVGRVDIATVSADAVFVNLVEFPYPSAEGLHVGHVFRYSGVDTYGRYMRMRGRQVFQPIGFDAFGIHTENYALKVGEHPATLTARTTARFAEQLTSAGNGVGLGPCDRHQSTRLLQVDAVGPGSLVRGRADVPGRGAGGVVPVVPDGAGPRADRGRRNRV